MGNLKRLAGVSCQIERKYEISSNRIHCKNCSYYQQEGAICRRHNTHISYNAANICSFFTNENFLEDEYEDYYDSLEEIDDKKTHAITIRKVDIGLCQLLIEANDNIPHNDMLTHTNNNISIITTKANALLIEKMKKVHRILYKEKNELYCYKVKKVTINQENDILNCIYEIKGKENFYLSYYDKMMCLQDKIHINDLNYKSVVLTTKYEKRRRK